MRTRAFRRRPLIAPLHPILGQAIDAQVLLPCWYRRGRRKQAVDGARNIEPARQVRAGHLHRAELGRDARIEQRLADAAPARRDFASRIHAHQQASDARNGGRGEARARGAAKTTADAGTRHVPARSDDALRPLIGTPVAGEERHAVVIVGAYREHARDGRRDGVARAALIAGRRNDENVAIKGVLQCAAQFAREGEQIGLLRGADVDDVGFFRDGGADAIGEARLRARRLQVLRRGLLEDRDGEDRAAGRNAGHDQVAGSGDDRLHERRVLDDAVRDDMAFRDRARLCDGRLVGRAIEHGDTDIRPAGRELPKQVQTRQARLPLVCNICLRHG